MSEFFTKDLTYNGSHACPKCGQDSEWRGIDADARLVRVQCTGTCGTYEKTYPELNDMPYFRQ